MDNANPVAIIAEPKMTVKRMPTRSATRPMRMPPTPEPIHISALASAGTERSPFASAAMLFSATTVIQGAPKAIAMITKMTVATTHDVRVSTDVKLGCSIRPAMPARPAPSVSCDL